MAYVYPNFRTKRELREGLAAGLPIDVVQPGLGEVPTDGVVYIEGPHGYHRWYAQGTMRGGRLVGVK